MKTLALIVFLGLAGASLAAGQQQMGRGRGGAPFAWNDKDKDGICDVTGKPVGQGRPIGWARGRGPARAGRANAWCPRSRANTQAAPEAPRKEEPKQ
jgi:hypothetical protein